MNRVVLHDVTDNQRCKARRLHNLRTKSNQSYMNRVVLHDVTDNQRCKARRLHDVDMMCT